MIGQTISHYRIVEKLGEGGMGVVYRAQDTKLDRAVALKFLPAQLLGNVEVRKRFEREAKSSAALSHPNLCRVYEIDEADGKTFLAMELIEGESLDRKIARGPLKLDEALSIGQQVAKGLEAAHKRGIVHRDIKPENIMVGEDGHVTIMDFGLAQLAEASRLTKTDETMGTVAYMSPEQTEGSGTDHRTDIWSFGVVLYEMVSGQQPFKGDYDKAVMYSILNQEPEPLTGLRTGVPMELELLVDKCLAKDSARRYQGLGETAVDLKTLAEKLKAARSTIRKTTISPLKQDEAAREPRTIRRQRLTKVLLTGFASVATLIAVAAVFWPRGTEAPPPLRKWTLTAPGEINNPVISPDGRYIAYATEDRPLRTLWVRDLSQEEARMVAGPGNLGPPFWSPRSDALAFQDGDDLKRVSPTGGAAATLCEGGTYGAWTRDGSSIVFSRENEFYIVSAQGGRPTLLFKSEHGARQVADPSFMPSEHGQSKLLYVAAAGGPTGRSDSEVFLRDLAAGETVSLAKGNKPIYSSSGHLIYESIEAPAGIWALPFSLDTYKPVGEPFVIRENASNPSVSSDGTLVYRVSEDDSAMRLVWRDRGGKLLGTIGQPQSVMVYPSLSPDGGRVAVRGEEGERSIWIHEVNRPVKSRLPGPTTSGGLWSASGLELVFSATEVGAQPPRIFRRASDGSGEPVLLHASDQNDFVSDWSADGRIILYDHGLSTVDVWYLKENDDGTGFRATPFLTGTFLEKAAKISPDGKFVAYVSDESGRYDVYVQRFPEGGRKRQISLDGGIQPRWRRDGSELFYVKDGALYAVAIQLGEEITVGPAQELFKDQMLRGTQHPHYDVSPDGQRFVVREALNQETGQAAISRTIVVENWYEEFREQEKE
jgi:serine/threonine protein kinase/Tol biopolymer transport system component